MFLEADYLDGTALPEGRYDFVSAVAVVHHAPFEEAVDSLIRLLAPGGRLVIVGMAYNRTALDWIISGCGLPVSLLLRRRRGGKRAPVGMPMEDATVHWGEARRAHRQCTYAFPQIPESSNATVNVSRWSVSQACRRSQRSHPPRSASAWR